MYINLSRLGKNGTGMWNYSIKFIEAISSLNLLTGIICSAQNAEYFGRFNVNLVLVPNWVSNTSKISKFRPVLWFVYSFWLSLKLFKHSKGELIVSTTHHALPLLKGQVITIHDLRPYYYPDSLLQKIYFHYLLPGAINRCRHVITVSNTVRQQIGLLFNYSCDNISVVYNAVDADCFTPQNSKKNFLLAVGSSWRHKNIDTLLKVHALWTDKYRVVIVCGNTGYVDELKNYVADNNISAFVEFKHNVPFGELLALYRDASALIYPSLDEGFGIPPIEAMASLTPVIVSNIPVFHEVLGDAAIYVDPEDSLSWQLALDKVPANTEWSHTALACAKKYNAELMCQMISAWLVKMKS